MSTRSGGSTPSPDCGSRAHCSLYSASSSEMLVTARRRPPSRVMVRGASALSGAAAATSALTGASLGDGAASAPAAGSSSLSRAVLRRVGTIAARARRRPSSAPGTCSAGAGVAASAAGTVSVCGSPRGRTGVRAGGAGAAACVGANA